MQPYVIVRVLSSDTYYFTNNDGEDHTLCLDGKVAYEVTGYADSVQDAKSQIQQLNFNATPLTSSNVVL